MKEQLKMFGIGLLAGFVVVSIFLLLSNKPIECEVCVECPEIEPCKCTEYTVVDACDDVDMCEQCALEIVESDKQKLKMEEVLR